MKRKIISLILSAAICFSLIAFAAVPASAAETITLGAKDGSYSDYCSRSFSKIKSITVPGHTFSVGNWAVWKCNRSDYVSGFISARVIKNNSTKYTLYLWSRVQKGSGNITITYNSGKKQTIFYQVKNAPTKVTLNKSSLTLIEGQTFDLDSYVNSGAASYQIKYSCKGDSAYVKEAGGLVYDTGLPMLGRSYVTARTYNGKTAVCTVNVVKKRK